MSATGEKQRKILIINPNSSPEVTEIVARTVASLAPPGVSFVVEDLPQSPRTISTEEDVARAGLDFADRVAAVEADAYVSACFSDPGVDIARGRTSRPVIGIQEAAMLTAMARAGRFGIIALTPAVLDRHLRKVRTMGVESRFAGDLALPGVSAAASGTDPEVVRRSIVLGLQLKEMGAGALVLGCAGMAAIRGAIEEGTGLPVIDPVLAGASMALGAVMV